MVGFVPCHSTVTPKAIRQKCAMLTSPYNDIVSDQRYNHFHTLWWSYSVWRWEQFKPMSPYLSALSFHVKRRLYGAIKWVWESEETEEYDKKEGEEGERCDGLEEGESVSWAMIFSLPLSSPLVSFLPPLCPLKTSMKEKEQKADFAIFFHHSPLCEAVFAAFITDRP